MEDVVDDDDRCGEPYELALDAVEDSFGIPWRVGPQCGDLDGNEVVGGIDFASLRVVVSLESDVCVVLEVEVGDPSPLVCDLLCDLVRENRLANVGVTEEAGNLAFEPEVGEERFGMVARQAKRGADGEYSVDIGVLYVSARVAEFSVFDGVLEALLDEIHGE